LCSRGEITLVLRPGTNDPHALEPPLVPSQVTDDTPAPSPDQPEPPPAITDGPRAAEDKDERHQLTGIVGRSPRFKQTKRGKAVASFPLAEHPQEGETHWREIRAFGRVAEFVRDSVQQGQPVEVTAYGPKTWSEWRKTKEGYAQRPVTGFYAGRIRVPQQPDSAA